jgi:hypothetical protein
VREGIPRQVKVGDILFTQGDRNFCFSIVLQGAVEIIEHASDTPHVVTTPPGRAVHRRTSTR